MYGIRDIDEKCKNNLKNMNLLVLQFSCVIKHSYSIWSILIMVDFWYIFVTTRITYTIGI